MVWYYGGAYFLGTAAMYPGHELALHGGVIVVGFNYRLSSIGWASTGSDLHEIVNLN
jgi:carboxylesterase type B